MILFYGFKNINIKNSSISSKYISVSDSYGINVFNSRENSILSLINTVFEGNIFKYDNTSNDVDVIIDNLVSNTTSANISNDFLTHKTVDSLNVGEFQESWPNSLLSAYPLSGSSYINYLNDWSINLSGNTNSKSYHLDN